MMISSHKRFSFAIRRARDFANFRPRRFLYKNYVKLVLSLKDSVDNERVFVNVLWKNFEILHNHIWSSPFSIEQINLDLFSWISAYFFCCHSLLNLCLQNRHWLESAWWSPQQFRHLNEWGHGSPFFVSNWGGLIFLLALQHHPNLWWFSDLWGPLHLTHLEPWILHEKVVCPHFQQFLHCRMSGFILAPQMVTIYLPMLKHLLISILALLLL